MDRRVDFPAVEESDVAAEYAAGLAVISTAAPDAATALRAALLADDVPARLLAKDPALWGPDAQDGAAARLGWVDTVRRSRDLLPRLAELRAETGDLDRVVLAGMGGSSLAPEVIARTLGRPLTVLDSTDPHQVRAALHGSPRADPGDPAGTGTGGPAGHRPRTGFGPPGDDPVGTDSAGSPSTDPLLRTVVVVASKSGSTVETDCQLRAFRQAFRDAGLDDAEAGRRFVVITDPGSPLERLAGELGAYLVTADPDVGGRYSALTAFGLVPAALVGVDVAELLDQAQALHPALGGPEDNPGLALAVALGTAARTGRPYVALAEDGTGVVGLADWVEQLLAESTGKRGTGLLPVVLESPTAAGAGGPDVLAVTVGGTLGPADVPGGGAAPDLAVNGPLGAQFLAWEYATAIAGRVLGVDPFDQPNVAEGKDNTARILGSGPPAERPSFTEGPIEVYGAPGGTGTVAAALDALLAGVAPDGYLAVTAFLDRFGDAAVAGLRPLLAARTGRPVTFGWGPRYLHSTGQYHKGGRQVGSFLQVTGAVTEDLDVPGRPYTFGALQAAQAAGDRQALRDRGRPVLRLHLIDRTAGAAALLAAARRPGGAGGT